MCGRLEIFAGRELDVLRDIDDDRTRTPAAGDIERFVQHARQVGDVLHQIVVLGAGPRDADGVAFLERVVADEMGRDLPGDADDRDRIHQRVGETRDRIGRAGARRHQQCSDFAGRASIAFRSVSRALLVADKDVFDLILLEYGVVDRQNGAARITENVLDALIGQRRDHHFRAGHFGRVILAVARHLPLHPVRFQFGHQCFRNQKGA